MLKERGIDLLRDIGVYSDEVGRRFRTKSATYSNRSRPGIPMIPATL
jgi:hypothetical protein